MEDFSELIFIFEERNCVLSSLRIIIMSVCEHSLSLIIIELVSLVGLKYNDDMIDHSKCRYSVNC